MAANPDDLERQLSSLTLDTTSVADSTKPSTKPSTTTSTSTKPNKTSKPLSRPPSRDAADAPDSWEDAASEEEEEEAQTPVSTAVKRGRIDSTSQPDAPPSTPISPPQGPVAFPSTAATSTRVSRPSTTTTRGANATARTLRRDAVPITLSSNSSIPAHFLTDLSTPSTVSFPSSTYPSSSTSGPRNPDVRQAKTASVAKRLIAQGLGVKIQKTEEERRFDRAQREAEMRKRNAARDEERRKVEGEVKAKSAIWED